MKKINNNILLFLGEIIFQYGLEKDLIEENELNIIDPLDKTFSLFFNKKVSDRIRNGEKTIDFHPLIKLISIVDDLINKKINYEDLPLLIKNKLNLSSQDSGSISISIKNNEEIAKLRNSINIESKIVDREVKEKSIGYQFLK
ncbi:MAG: hypothetical protein PHG37_03520 [Candidatus Pacebacteria bacterium]|nr:hypothetical protein [Candidatus Paceibacterota bacterium]